MTAAATVGTAATTDGMIGATTVGIVEMTAKTTAGIVEMTGVTTGAMIAETTGAMTVAETERLRP